MYTKSEPKGQLGGSGTLIADGDCEDASIWHDARAMSKPLVASELGHTRRHRLPLSMYTVPIDHAIKLLDQC